jgi:alpha-glucosidase (family GH31 glycosyl hydrolase)
VRAGAVIPLDPVRQYTDEPVKEPMTLVVYPGADGTSTLYEDDGTSFDYRTGEAMSIVMSWSNAARRLSLNLAAGSRMLPPSPRTFAVRLAGQTSTRTVTFAGKPVQITL